MFGSLVDWVREQVQDHRAIWAELGRLQAAAETKVETPSVMAQITYYGGLGEMGHPADRAYPDDGEW